MNTAIATPHFNRTFPKVLTTNLGQGLDRKRYLLPYRGNLTQDKFCELARKLIAKVLGENTPVVDRDVEKMAERLKNTWFTGREQGVALEVGLHGTISLRGEGWMSFGLSPDDVVVVE